MKKVILGLAALLGAGLSFNTSSAQQVEAQTYRPRESEQWADCSYVLGNCIELDTVVVMPIG
ncbi:hypothetical protein LCGC14_0123550 [marine sediment metagenome]|uniref:Uncharacterized protein n=1 Tax=marine sediment metagenome TaxID=412755 RepID=A0A0F9XNH6_9ZZZZ|nr:hypothetical protein [Maribacter sp.]HDZ05812.1 hypothetical protein [Maribacter sp.]|tara:strand:- start:153 stop:338 length:186 start_codon:yes stop_codon:yes gene_type:complete